MSNEKKIDEGEEEVPADHVVYLSCPKCGYRAMLVDESEPPFTAEVFLNLARIADPDRLARMWSCPRCAGFDHKTVGLEVSFYPF